MAVARSGHVAALLSNGKVLIAGGVDMPTNGTSIASAELYDPGSKTFTLIGSMTACAALRYVFGEAIVRSEWKCLNCWGCWRWQGILSNADLYGTTGFSATGPMSAARFLHAAALLTNGEVLVTGGGSSGGALARLTYSPPEEVSPQQLGQ